ncbi:AAA family ATPase [Paracoccus gahaiensis]|nr:AAA family ATPase [Paracoccus gahaiensis]
MYITPAHHDILAMVRAWRIGDRPLLVMTGDSGTGKTTFARKLAATFGATMQVGLLDAEKMQSADLRQQVPAAFGSDVRFLPHDPLTSHDQFMAECLTTGRRRLLIVDEAQHLTEAALDYLQRVTTPPRSGLPVFYVVLIGGPELQALLARPDLQALQDRIGSQLQLSPFTEAQTAAYVDHRLRVSDCQCAVSDLTFEAGRLGLLHEASGGRPKMINRLVQRVLFDPVRAGAAVKVARTVPPPPPVEDKPVPAPPPTVAEHPTPLPAPAAPVAEDAPVAAQRDAARDQSVAVPDVEENTPVVAQPKVTKDEPAADPATAKLEPAVPHPALGQEKPVAAPPVVVQPVAAPISDARDRPAAGDRARAKTKPQPAPPPVITARPAPLKPAKVDEAKAPFQRPATWGKAVPLQPAAARDPSAPRPSLVRDKPAPTQPALPRPESRRPGPLKPAATTVAPVARPAPAEAAPSAAPTARPGPVRTAPSVVMPRQKRIAAPDGVARRGLPWGLAGAAGLGLVAAGVFFLGQADDQPAPIDMAAPSPTPVAAPPVAPAPAASPEPTPAPEGVAPEAAPAPAAVAPVPEPQAPPPAPGLRGASTDPVPDADALLTEALAAGATDPDQAAQLYTQAALWGNARAAYYLGQLYETGIGVPQNPDRARAAYALALEVDGAADRLEALDGRATPQTSAAAPPVPLSQRVFATGATELHWRDPEGAVASGFRVEFIPAGGEDIQQTETVLPALLLDQPLARWRVMALGADGSVGPASEWSLPDPALP